MNTHLGARRCWEIEWNTGVGYKMCLCEGKLCNGAAKTLLTPALALSLPLAVLVKLSYGEAI